MSEVLTREQVAEELRLTPRQVDELRWAGLLGFIDTSAGTGKRATPRFLPEHIEEFKRKRNVKTGK